MSLNVQVEQVEKTSPILRKLTIRVPAQEVATRYQRGLAEVQRTANLKGFRVGHAPISVIKQFYGEDVRHRLFHNLIDESFQVALRDQKLKAVGSPKIETPDHKTGAGEHDHTLHEDRDLTFTATVEILPEIEPKGYTGVSLTREKFEVTDADVETTVKNMLDSQAKLLPAGSGLTDASGKSTSRPVKKGDYVDMTFKGGIVTPAGVVAKDGMSGTRMIEVGSDSLIPGFEDNLVGMRTGETKTFNVKFPADFFEKEMAGQDSEFTVTINELKEKKLPELNDEFAKGQGYESVADLRVKAKEHLLKEKTAETDRKLRAELVEHLIAKNPFDVPAALIESQTRALAQDWAQELQRQGLDEKMIQSAVMSEIENLRKRADSQVRASLILESIATKEKLEVKPADMEEEMKTFAASMRVDMAQLQDFYAKNPGRQDDFVFRVRQERTLKYLVDQAKIKTK